MKSAFALLKIFPLSRVPISFSFPKCRARVPVAFSRLARAEASQPLGFSADLRAVESSGRQPILELAAAFTTEPIMPESHHDDFRTVL